MAVDGASSIFSSTVVFTLRVDQLRRNSLAPSSFPTLRKSSLQSLGGRAHLLTALDFNISLRGWPFTDVPVLQGPKGHQAAAGWTLHLFAQ